MPTLDFNGKHHIYTHHLTIPYRPLETDKSRSCNPTSENDNLIIHGDNLHALKALLPRYKNRIKCIYIDPPYNTGNEGWVYNDNVNSPLIKQWFTENAPVDNEDLERHDKWLCMMWSRLHLLKELLAEDGVIFISIDDNEVHHLRMLMDEIFGEKNFFAILTRRAMHTVRNSGKDFNHNADYTLVYAKEKSWFGEDKSRYIRYITDKSTKYPHDDNDGRGKYKLDPLSARNYYEPYTFTFENGVVWSPPSGRYPSYAQDTLRCMEREGRIDFSGKEPRAKRYLSEVQEGQPPDVFLSPKIVGFNKEGTGELRDIFGEGGVFPQPKPIKFIKFLLELLRSKDAIILFSMKIKNHTLKKRSAYPISRSAFRTLCQIHGKRLGLQKELIESLKTNGETDEKIYDRRSYLISMLQEHVAGEVENQSEQIFRKKLDSGEIQFDLEVGEPNYKLRQSYKIEVHANQNLLTKYGKPVQLSLFEPMYEYASDNELEKNFAHFLDGEKALQWWHRVVARQQGEYYVQGWNEQRIYPDFVAMAKEVEGMTRVLIFETKGQHLEGNRDTKYKQKVLKTLEEAFNTTGNTSMREVPTQTGIFRLVFSKQEFPEISAQLNEGRYSTES